MKHCLLVTLFLSTLLAPSLRAGDWPGWRGPTGMGTTDAKGLPLHWDKSGRGVVWSVPLPGADGKAKFDHNQSSPIVCGERVFLIMVYWPEGVAQTEYPEHHVACCRTIDGKLLWDTKVAPGPWKLTDLRGGYLAPTPCTDGQRVYALFGSSTLAALDLDGKIIWQKPIEPFAWDVAIGASPVLYKDTVLVLADGTKPKDSRLIAFDARSGDIRWQRARPTSSFSHTTPVVAEINGRPQLLIASSNALQGVDPADGHIIWWVTNKGDVPTPVLGGGLIFSIDGRGGPGIAVAPSGEGDITESAVKWRTPPVNEGYSSAVIVGDYLYRVHQPGILTCRKLATGELVWSERVPAGVDHAASPIASADGRIYFATGGKSLVLAAGPKYEVLATNDLGDPGRASPAVANGRIYVKGGKRLWCLGEK